ncbi:hypothetical protein B0T10DRAFT_497707 [Thelonectria olida]|uniref:Zn(2)-C6 fungal-type domain-containing protein n=1 Tax=Thelonectria olida TaxID=1576542 RepID=A0A9P8VSM5_9HYPO|nr:hypothetical protein B0T10DRAFT_497707 [Thelonectria olida]
MARSRGGCVNCKKRKRKCDETRPGCAACARRGIQCDGYATPLRWTNGIAVRGRFAGASVPDVAAAAAAAASSSKGSGLVQLMPPDDAADASSSSPCSVAFAGSDSTSQSGLSSSPGGDVGGTERELFAKFLNSGLRRLYTTETQCWIQPFFREMSLESPALVTVSAAIQAYLDDGKDVPSVSSMEHVDLALQTFRRELASRQESMHAATLCAGLLLCTLRLLQAQPWTMYIDLIADAYHLRTRMHSPGHVPVNNMAIRHSLEVMGVMDIPSMVIGRLSPPVGIWKLLRNLQDTQKQGRLDGIEVVSGLPRSLLDIFASILENDVEYTESRLWAWPGEIGEYLQCHLWDCWRYSGILDVRRRKRMKQRGQGSMGGNQVQAAPASELVLCRLMASMDALNRSFELPQNEHLLCHNGMMYPLVTASLEVELLKEHPHWRRTLLEVRQAFLRRDSFKLLKVAFQTLDEVWASGSSNFDIDQAAMSKGVEIAVF